MKKIILILAVMMFSTSVASAQVEVNANATGNEVQAQEDTKKENNLYEELRIIDGQIAKAAAEGQPIEDLEKQRQQIIEKIKIMENDFN